MYRSVKEAASELEARLSAARERRFPVMGLKGAAGVLMLRETALRLDRPIVAIASRANEAEALANELAFFLGEPADADALQRRVHHFPAWEVKPFAHVSPPSDVQGAQVAALYAMLRQRAPIVISSVEALMMRTIPRAILSDSIIRVADGDRLDLEILVDALTTAGYQRIPQVEEPGDFSVRGGIVDVFSPLLSAPVRIEMEDDVVTSIRRFDPATQRSAGSIDEAAIVRTRFVAQASLKDTRVAAAVAVRAADIGMVRKEVAELDETLANGLLFPGAELLMPYLYDAQLAPVLGYVPDNAIMWLLDPGRIVAEAQRYAEKIESEAAAATERHSFHPDPPSLYVGADEFENALSEKVAVEVGSLVTVLPPREGWAEPVEIKSQQSLRLSSTELSGGRAVPSFEPLANELKEVQRGQGRALMIVEGPHQVARLKRHLEAYDLEINTECKSFAELLEWPDFRPAIMEGEISAGTVLQLDGIYLYSEEELFGEQRVRRRARRPTAKGAILDLEELKPEDLVVHIDHGIGRFRGLKHLKVADVEGDFLNLEYAANDTMYVPVERINLVQRYIGGDSEEPKLDRLGSGSWEKVKARTRKAVLAMAAELLEIYAAREVLEAHAFPMPGEYLEFADKFEFEETADQQAAIDDVIRDLTRPKPMDRLICGDAGFGKTEVALRAAFVAVMDARQVAVLVPTTILAEQHFNTFRKRFAGYPVRIEMVSRFRSAKENRQVIEDLGTGKVDIVVGTHRLLQSGVNFPRLGLLIIDEEHRFGVADKERIKRLKKLVAVLTMTATPIPRTLHMAMLGIRDLSLIQTPPPDRQQIRTFVAHFDDALIREVALRELNRGGQVFFVHNRVENIDYMARHLRTLIPEAKIAVAHGQMNERQLEDVMREFVDNRVNLLVCSAIIESGLDIPNANTMIVNRADHFGLAQLYQLRGRVGRSRQKAYAYLLIPGEHIITRDAKRRIDALRELVEAESGSGFKLAMADLEHRGAGNLLGREQSGEITAVGFELYTEMMEQAIAELRGEDRRPDFEPELKLGIPAYIPDAYVPDENERLVLYRRFGRANTEQDLFDLRDEIRDRFGPVPTLVENLVAAMNLRRQMKDQLILSAIIKGTQLEVRFHPDAPVETAKLAALVDANRRTMKLTPSYQVIVHVTPGEYPEIFAQIDGILQALAACEKLERPTRTAGQVVN